MYGQARNCVCSESREDMCAKCAEEWATLRDEGHRDRAAPCMLTRPGPPRPLRPSPQALPQQRHLRRPRRPPTSPAGLSCVLPLPLHPPPPRPPPHPQPAHASAPALRPGGCQRSACTPLLPGRGTAARKVKGGDRATKSVSGERSSASLGSVDAVPKATLPFRPTTHLERIHRHPRVHRRKGDVLAPREDGYRQLRPSA
jgi:hypothetical protein